MLPVLNNQIICVLIHPSGMSSGGKKVKKSKDGSTKLELEAKTREAELDKRVKKKSDRFCMHT